MRGLRLSKSKVNSYLTCPLKYYLGYELSIWPLKKSIAMINGLVTHQIIEIYLKRLEEGKPFELDGTHKAVWTQYPMKSTDADSQDYQEAIDQSFTLARLFITRLKVQPLMVEHRFELPVINLATGQVAENLSWVGIMDHVNIRDDGDLVVDIKTKAKKGDPFDARTAIELTGYAYAYRMITEKREAGVSLVNLVKTKIPDIQPLEDYRDEEDFNEFFNTLVAVAEGIAGKRFHRSPGFHCGYCDYKPICARNIEQVVERFGEESYEKLLSL